MLFGVIMHAYILCGINTMPQKFGECSGDITVCVSGVHARTQQCAWVQCQFACNSVFEQSVCSPVLVRVNGDITASVSGVQRGHL